MRLLLTCSLGAADRARTRAQNAYTIFNAIAGGLIGFAIVTDLRSTLWPVQALAAVSVATWLRGAAVYVRAVSTPFDDPLKRGETVRTGSEMVDKVLGAADSEYKEVEAHRQKATKKGHVAAVLTAVTFALALFLPPGSSRKAGTMVLTDAGQRTLSTVCTVPPAALLEGSIELDSLDDRFTIITVEAKKCQNKKAKLRLLDEHVAVIKVD